MSLSHLDCSFCAPPLRLQRLAHFAVGIMIVAAEVESFAITLGSEYSIRVPLELIIMMIDDAFTMCSSSSVYWYVRCRPGLLCVVRLVGERLMSYEYSSIKSSTTSSLCHTHRSTRYNKTVRARERSATSSLSVYTTSRRSNSCACLQGHGKSESRLYYSRMVTVLGP